MLSLVPLVSYVAYRLSTRC